MTVLRREASPAGHCLDARVCPRTGQFWRQVVGSTSGIWNEGLISVWCNERADETNSMTVNNPGSANTRPQRKLTGPELD